LRKPLIRNSNKRNRKYNINLCSNAYNLILKFSKVQNLEFRLLINYGALKLDTKIILYLIHTLKGAPIE